MRKSRQETARTRQRIVEAASAEFRKKGIDGAGISDITAAAGLTNGGFYKHFASKDQVLREALTFAVQSLMDDIEAAGTDGNGLDGVIARYLSVEHRDQPNGGCPFVALGSDLTRCSPDVRHSVSADFERAADAIAMQMGTLPRAAAKKQALLLLSTMIGAAIMARVVTDPKLSATILAEARKHLTDPGGDGQPARTRIRRNAG